MGYRANPHDIIRIISDCLVDLGSGWEDAASQIKDRDEKIETLSRELAEAQVALGEREPASYGGSI